MSTGRGVLIAGIVAVAVALASPGVANADNSNNNTNTNDVSQIGNPSDSFPRANESTNWPQAGSSWPPGDITNSGGENGSKPIVMPMGGPAPTEGAGAQAATPIVP